MDLSNKDLADPLASKADREATKKVARDTLVSARMEKKVKGISVENARRKAAWKATLQFYFSSSCGSGSGQPLNLVLDSRFPDVPGATTKLVREVDNRFHAHNVMSALGIMYPQYWCQGDADDHFDKHLRTLMDAYGHGQIIGEGSGKALVKPLINRDMLMSQRGLFRTCMRSNARSAMLPPFTMNPLTKVWRVLDRNNSLTQNFSKFIKLAEIVVTHVIRSVEDERTFSSLAFLKSKLRASLVENLEVTVGMYSQKVFSLESFPYQQVFDEWFKAGDRGCYLAHA